jgi:formylglycine-generating enzyme required for sulfatase activity
MVRVLIFLLLALLPQSASAQLVRDHDGQGAVRGFHGPASAGRIKRSFQSDTEARAEFERILSAVGLSWITDRIALRATPGTDNAEAGIDNNGERFIFYNATFMQNLKQRTADDWSPVSILAHELGHHLAFHTELDGRYHEFELEADYFSGFVLRRLGATLDQAHAAMRAVSPREASETHPGLDERLQAITVGWTDGGAQGTPPGLKKRGDATAGLANPASRPSAALLPKPEPMFSPSRNVGPLTAEEESALRQDKDNRHRGAGFRECVVCPEMAVVPSGTFMMGSPDSEAGRGTNEGPQREMTIAQPFAAGKFEVTFDEWDACVTDKRCEKVGDSGFGTGRRPVINVSWNQIDKQYLPWLNDKIGKPGAYRLLSEAEWEYAARGVTAVKAPSKRYHFGNEESDLCTYGNVRDLTAKEKHGWTGVANCRDGYVETAPVGSFRPNAFGLHDMHGNVWEWVQDCWNDNYGGAFSDGTARTTGDCARRLLRGGSWDNIPRRLRSAVRNAYPPGDRYLNIGFRVGRTL